MNEAQRRRENWIYCREQLAIARNQVGHAIESLDCADSYASGNGVINVMPLRLRLEEIACIIDAEYDEIVAVEFMAR